MSERICSVDGCDKKHEAKGYCQTHYKRLKTRGSVSDQKGHHHGLHDTPEYHTWESMIQRCHNQKTENYIFYGGKGISVCLEWRNSFLSFLKDMGNRPSKNSQMDRKDANKNYSKENCRWLSPLDNNRNRDCLKLDIETAKKIFKLKGKMSTDKIGEMFGVSRTTVNDIFQGRTWKEASSD